MGCHHLDFFYIKVRFFYSNSFTRLETEELYSILGLETILFLLMRWCAREAVGWLSGKNHHNFEAKIKFGRWFRYHRRAYPTPSVLTPVFGCQAGVHPLQLGYPRACRANNGFQTACIYLIALCVLISDKLSRMLGMRGCCFAPQRLTGHLCCSLRK